MMVGVLLAAGASSRMGSPKALMTTSGGSFLSRGIRHLWSACDQVIVVLGSNAARIRESLKAAPAKFQATCVKLALNEKTRWLHLETPVPLCMPFTE